jgi:hypothetical protein
VLESQCAHIICASITASLICVGSANALCIAFGLQPPARLSHIAAVSSVSASDYQMSSA